MKIPTSSRSDHSADPRSHPDGTGLRKISPFGDIQPGLTNKSHALNGDGTVALIASSVDYKGGNPEKDYEIFMFRDALTQTGQATPGATVVYNLEAPTEGGAAYLVRCAFSRSPGIPVPGVGTVPITPDDLFWLSGQAPTIFKNFGGVLTSQGKGAAAVAIPGIPGLTGISYYTTFITVAAAARIYNPVLTQIQ